MKIVKHFTNLNFTIAAKPQEYIVEYEIFDHDGITDNGEPLFHKRGSISSPDTVESIEEAEVYLSGYVKWDGCSNWYFNEQDRVMLHGCCRDDILRYGLIMAECFDLTKDLCENWYYV